MTGVGALHVVVVVAHPDDETFGCGPLLLHAAAAGARTSVSPWPVVWYSGGAHE